MNTTTPVPSPYVHSPMPSYEDVAADNARQGAINAGTYSPTVISDSTIRDKVIPDINSKAASLLPPVGVSIGPNGEWIDGRTQDKRGTDQKSAQYAPLSYGESLSSAIDEIDSAPLAISPEQTMLLEIQQRMSDDLSRNAISKISSQYSQKLRALEQSQRSSTDVLRNTLGNAGSSRYAPVSSQGILSAKERYDLQTLNDLQEEENQLILEAQNAKSGRDFQILQSKLELLEKKRQEKLSIAKDIANKMSDENKLQAQERMKEQEDMRKAITDAAKGGAPRDVLEKARDAKSLVEAVSILGDYIAATGTGIVSEYAFYKNEAAKQGLTPVSFEDYQNADANRKKAAVTPSGIPPNVVSQIDKLSAAFDSAPITKQFNEAVNQKLSFDNIISNGVGGPADLAIVYQFMKALDPTSVVRETEYETARKSGNIFAGTFAKYNGYLKEKGGFLPEGVKSEFQNVVNQKMKAIRSQYDNLKSETARKINMKTGMDDGSDYLTDYAAPLGEEIINRQKSAQDQIDTYYVGHPDDQAFIDELETVFKGDQEALLDYLIRAKKIEKKMTFNDVGGDTNIASIRNAIASIESGGSYSAKSPVNRNGERAYGRYQILESNIPAWAQEAVGRRVTLQEFLANPSLQDRIAEHQMKKIYARYGNPDDVAAVWFSGRPLKGNVAADVTGTNVPEYVRRFRKALNNA